MRRKLLWWLLVWEPLAELAWILLRWSDNRRKGKPASEFWSYVWAMMMYGVVNGHIPLSDIEREWRQGTWFEYRGKRYLDPDLVGVDLSRDDSTYTLVGQRGES